MTPLPLAEEEQAEEGEEVGLDDLLLLPTDEAEEATTEMIGEMEEGPEVDGEEEEEEEEEVETEMMVAVEEEGGEDGTGRGTEEEEEGIIETAGIIEIETGTGMEGIRRGLLEVGTSSPGIL